MRAIRRKKWEEQGNIAPLAIAATLMLFVVLALSVDQGIACAAKVRQENALDTARGAYMNASFALMAKNDEDPGRMVAMHFAEALRRQGFEGTVSVWFYEVSASELPSTRRIWGVAVQLQEQTPTVFARGYGIPSISVASKRIVIAEPFSDWEVWRPGQVGKGNGRYDVGAESAPTQLSFTPLGSFEEYPEELRHDTQAAIANVVKNYGKEKPA